MTFSICLKLVYVHDSGATYGVTDTLGKDIAKVIAFALFMRIEKRASIYYIKAELTYNGPNIHNIGYYDTRNNALAIIR